MYKDTQFSELKALGTLRIAKKLCFPHNADVLSWISVIKRRAQVENNLQQPSIVYLLFSADRLIS